MTSTTRQSLAARLECTKPVHRIFRLVPTGIQPENKFSFDQLDTNKSFFIYIVGTAMNWNLRHGRFALKIVLVSKKHVL